MHNPTKISFLFFTFTLFVYFNSFFPSNTDAQTDNEPTPSPPEFTFTYESIDVSDVDFLAVTASSDFEGYAGYTRSVDGEKMVAFTFADGRRHGFIARLDTQEERDRFSNAYTVTLSKGLNMLSVPLAPPTPMTAKNLVAMTGATAIIAFDAPN